jgi:hypothetical protein
MREHTVNSLAEYIDKISEISRADRHQHLRWWFRGVPNAEFKLIPSVFRSPPRNGYDLELGPVKEFRHVANPRRGVHMCNAVIFLIETLPPALRFLEVDYFTLGVC